MDCLWVDHNIVAKCGANDERRLYVDSSDSVRWRNSHVGRSISLVNEAEGRRLSEPLTAAQAAACNA